MNRYEDEINKRTAAENEFVVLKKVSRGQGAGQVVFWLPGCWADLEKGKSPGS